MKADFEKKSAFLFYMKTGINKFSNAGLICIVAVISFIISVIFNLGYTELDGEEPRRALISIEMLHSGNYIVPTLYGWEYYNKPPLFNWILSGFMFITQSTKEWVVRLPSLVFFLLWALTHYYFTKKYISASTALLSAIFLLTGGELYFYGLQNGGEMDIFYAFIVYLQVISLFYFFEKRNWLLLFIASYFFCAIGFLTKAFPSVLFQGLNLFALILYAKSFRIFLKWQHLAGILVFLLLVGSYFYAYSLYSSPQRLLINLLNESIRKTPLSEESGNFWQNIINYPVRMFTGLLPWSFIPFLLFLPKPKPSFWSNPLLRFSILFIICNIWVYWFFGVVKLRYSYMFYPFMTLFFAVIFDHYCKFLNLNKVLKYVGFAFILLLIATLLLPVFFEFEIFPFIIVISFLAFFIYKYFNTQTNLIWFFAAGIIIVRFSYAALYMPIMDENRKSTKYRIPLKQAAAFIGSDTIRFYAKPDTLPISIDLKFFTFRRENILVPPEIFKQVPYYYYQASKKLVNMDSVIQNNQYYFSYMPYIKDSSIIQKHFTFYDSRMQSDFILFKRRE